MLTIPFGFMAQPQTGGGLWTPSDLAVAPHAWWDATIGVADTANAVDSWTDQGALAISATVPDTAPSTNTATQNGLNVIHFDDDSLTFISTPIAGIKAVMIVCGELDGSVSISSIGSMFGATGDDFTYINCNKADVDADVYMNGGDSNTGNASWAGNTLVSGGVIDLGLTNVQNEGWSVWYIDYDVAISVEWLGAVLGQANYKLKGKMAELIFLDNVPTLDEREQLTGYACHRWGLTADMPADHTYKSAAPTT